MKPLHVQDIRGERYRFEVESETQPSMPFLIDLSEAPSEDQCPCRMEHKRRKSKDGKPCKHVIAALRRFVQREMELDGTPQTKSQ